MEIGMKNDLDLIRKILEEVESRVSAGGATVEIAGWREEMVARHVERLCDDGLLDRERTVGHWIDETPDYYVRDLTSAGHEFLNAIRSGDVIERLKSALKPSELGALSMKKIAGIAGELMEKSIRKKLGLD